MQKGSRAGHPQLTVHESDGCSTSNTYSLSRKQTEDIETTEGNKNHRKEPLRCRHPGEHEANLK